MIETVVIGHRFNGPPTTGNGGYSAGTIAALYADAATATEVTLRRPPPLDTELTVRRGAAGLSVHDGDGLVAEAAPGELTGHDLVAGVPYDEAVVASASYRGFTDHPFPTCFVCGPKREPGDGLRLFPGRLADRRTATPFVAPPEISSVLLWAALDCPGGWALPMESRLYVLGRLTARVIALPEPGDECVIMGEARGEDGRRAFAATTVYAPTGGVLAHARATWVALAGG